jgi:glycogen debranching enzyme
MRQGPWIYDYTLARLNKYLNYYPGLELLIEWLTLRISLVKKLPAAFAPKYFTIVILSAYEGVKHQALFTNPHTKFVPAVDAKSPSSLGVFAYNCALTSFQMYGSVKSTGLLPGPYPLPMKGPQALAPVIPVRGLPIASLAAGLPHFATEYSRCWGRDIFIALRGLFMLTGAFDLARTHIIAFGSTLKHGLIPNLLDQGIRPRYNARDAAWFWLDAVCCYIRESTEGIEFLNASVARRFVPLKRYMNKQSLAGDAKSMENQDDFIPPNDPKVYMHTSTIAELCHEILERHANGINFREWNAGTSLDHAMKSEGFDLSAQVDMTTGFVSGGNRWNCGTWMDKMGDSTLAGTFGVPATPRDGSAIELVGLQKSVLSFVNSSLMKSKYWSWKGVSCTIDGKESILEYPAWEKKIADSFETCFYIPSDKAQDSQYRIERPDLVNIRGIYKDTFGSSTPFADFQLRPNCCIAMVKVFD